MPDFRIEHTFECSEDTFWSKIIFDDDYNQRLYKERLRFQTWREIKREDSGDVVRRVIEAVPPIGELPAALKAVIGEGIGYEEHGVYEKSGKRYTVTVVPNRLADKVKVAVEITTQPSGPDRCVRVAKGSVNAKIFGVGGMLEKKMIADLEKSYAKSAEFTNAYLKEKGIK